MWLDIHIVHIWCCSGSSASMSWFSGWFRGEYLYSPCLRGGLSYFGSHEKILILMFLVQKYRFWCFLCKNIHNRGRIPLKRNITLCYRNIHFEINIHPWAGFSWQCQLRILFNLKSANKIMMIWKQCGKTESWKSQITLGNVVSMFVLKGSIMWLIQGSRLLLRGEVLQAVVSNWEARGGKEGEGGSVTVRFGISF